MKTETRLAFNQLKQQIATINGVENVSEKFTVTPTVQQTLENHIQQSSAFLSQINVVPVDEMEGQKLGLYIGSPIASRTNTNNADRNPKDPSALDDQTYKCYKTDFDTALRYSKLDAWAKFPDFQTRVRDMIVRQQALDRIMIGFNGESAAATTNPETNPLLQDVNIGWIQQFKNNASARVMTHGSQPGHVRIGEGGDYENLDALVVDAVNNLVDEVYAEDPDLVVLVGRSLLQDKYFPIVNQNLAPSEKIASDVIVSQKRMGGLQAVQAPFFPANALMITSLSNLSIYYQNGARRRTLVDNAKRDQIENYESSNEAYVVENYKAGCVVTNITLI